MEHAVETVEHINSFTSGNYSAAHSKVFLMFAYAQCYGQWVDKAKDALPTSFHGHTKTHDVSIILTANDVTIKSQHNERDKRKNAFSLPCKLR